MPAQYAAIRALTLAAYAEYADVMTPTAWQGLRGAVTSALDDHDSPAERIVALRGTALLGSVMLFPPSVAAYDAAAGEANWPELRLLAVDHAARGQGIGKLLVRECVRRARAAGATDLGLHTSDSLWVAVRMYEQMGFLRAPAYDFQPDGAELVKAYRLPLTNG